MSEPMLRISASEIKTVRVVCKCGKGVVEVPVERLNNALDHGECRFCNRVFFKHSIPDPLNWLKSALEELERLKDVLEVEFEVPLPK